MFIEQNDVELISIKTKSTEDLDNDIRSDGDSRAKNSKNSKKFHDYTTKTTDNDDSEFPEEYIDDEQFESSVRFLKIAKSPNGACGFHLTRTKWDPYPWVSAVDNFTPAEKCGLKAGDCVLEVNGCDVLGLRITEIAKLVKSSQHQVTLLLWSTNCSTECDKESLCAAPMPRSLQRLSLVVQTVLSIIECPVCLDTITPPAMQCQNGHLLCVNCRIRAENCPVCRDRYYPRPALIAEQIQTAITSAFNLCRNEDKVRQKIFGRHNRQRQMVKTTLECLGKNRQQQHEEEQQEVHKSLTTDSEIILQNTTIPRHTTAVEGVTPASVNGVCDRKAEADILRKRNTTKNACNKFLTRFLNSKAYSMENLTNGYNTNKTTATNDFSTSQKPIMSAALIQPQLFAILQRQQCSDLAGGEKGLECGKIVEKSKQQTILMEQQQHHPQQQQLNPSTNQFNNFSTNVKNNHLLTSYKPNFNGSIENDLNINSNPCCKQMFNNNLKYFPSISTGNDLTRPATTAATQSVSCLLESPTLFMMNGSKRPCPVPVCETSYQTIPRAIKAKAKILATTCLSCQHHDGNSNTETLTNSTISTNSLKSHCSSTSSLNLMPHLCSTLSLSSSSSPSSQSCQFSLSSTEAAAVVASSPETAAILPTTAAPATSLHI